MQVSMHTQTCTTIETDVTRVYRQMDSNLLSYKTKSTGVKKPIQKWVFFLCNSRNPIRVLVTIQGI
jgi:hypothetical protein